MVKRMWDWLKATFTALFGVRPATEVIVDDDFAQRKVRSANICLASHGATKRERSNALTTLWRWGV